MISRISLFFVLFGYCFYSGCTSVATKSISLFIENGADQKFYLEEVSLAGGESKIIDSFFSKERVASYTVSIPSSIHERLMRIRSADRRIRVWLIDEKGALQVKVNYLEPDQFEISGSVSSISLRNFSTWYQRFVQENRKGVNFDSAPPSAIDTVLLREQLQIRRFIDTTSSVACALFFYSAVDFGKDYQALDQFIERLQKRFPNDSRLNELYIDTKNYINIFTQELQIGDQIPDFYLQSLSGAYLPLSYYRTGYQLIDCWASFDALSLIRRTDIQEAYKRYGSKFSLAMISLDPVKMEWERYLELQPQPGLQFIDDASWKGGAASRLKFDSIPFNFLVDPKGRIIGKALYGNALLVKLDSLFGQPTY